MGGKGLLRVWLLLRVVIWMGSESGIVMWVWLLFNGVGCSVGVVIIQ